MSSKLFHTVVAFGISFGAATSVGCAAAPADEAAQSEAAQTASDNAANTVTTLQRMPAPLFR
jgi:hypothetical protein